jgi:hypothetical protein
MEHWMTGCSDDCAHTHTYASMCVRKNGWMVRALVWEEGQVHIWGKWKKVRVYEIVLGRMNG